MYLRVLVEMAFNSAILRITGSLSLRKQCQSTVHPLFRSVFLNGEAANIALRGGWSKFGK